MIEKKHQCIFADRYLLFDLDLTIVWDDSIITGLVFFYLNYIFQKANKASSRKTRPWIIALGHRPMYCSNQDGLYEHCNNRKNPVSNPRFWFSLRYPPLYPSIVKLGYFSLHIHHWTTSNWDYFSTTENLTDVLIISKFIHSG